MNLKFSESSALLYGLRPCRVVNLKLCREFCAVLRDLAVQSCEFEISREFCAVLGDLAVKSCEFEISRELCCFKGSGSQELSF